ERLEPYVRKPTCTVLRGGGDGNITPLTRPMRRGHSYGTLLVDLPSHRPVDVLPDRTADTLSRWLRAHPGVHYVGRDRSAEYARGISEGAPSAHQVVDRWHLMKNVREVLARVLGRVYETVKQRQLATGLPV